MTPNWRQTLTDYIRTQALPVDKFSHQPRLYALACRLAGDQPFDDDVLFAACCLRGEAFGFLSGEQLAGFAILTPWHVRHDACYASKVGDPPQNTFDFQDVMVHPDFRRRFLHGFRRNFLHGFRRNRLHDDARTSHSDYRLKSG